MFSAADGGGSDRVFEALIEHLPQQGVEADGLVVGPGQRHYMMGVSTLDALNLLLS